MNDLCMRKHHILNQKENYWRLKSKAVCLAKGDGNTSFFHKYASQRRNRNSIWEVRGVDGVFKSETTYIQESAVHYFKEAYKQPWVNNLLDQLNITKLFPRFFSSEEGLRVDAPISMSELKVAPNSLDKEKSPGPDGWTSEFFVHF